VKFVANSASPGAPMTRMTAVLSAEDVGEAMAVHVTETTKDKAIK